MFVLLSNNTDQLNLLFRRIKSFMKLGTMAFIHLFFNLFAFIIFLGSSAVPGTYTFAYAEYCCGVSNT
ncbi:hypothetical protein NPIL_300061 [Nephila pilipes]|uniref:Uncharacterized protein n=1 Tax=Nephila pilipes TaxID=299642 RepID=A0A8X6PSS6_NEPPI|nr:hypothetical protein NPIL_300061 [Nephila pilipes]